MLIGGINLTDQNNPIKTNTQYQCIGCGALIQTEEPDQEGYLPVGAFKKGEAKGEFYCQRCYRLRHYNELSDLKIADDVFLDRLNQVAEDDAFVINVVDILDLEGSLFSGLSRFISNQPFAVFANKYDLLPKAQKIKRIRQRITERLHHEGLRPQEIIVGSANQKDSLTRLIDLIKREILHHNIYIVGATNVGKSTLINQLIRYFGGEAEIITTSNMPGTTLNLIEIPLTEETSLIDTPGIVRNNQVTYYLNRDDIDKVLPRKRIKPRNFQLNEGQAILFAGLAGVDYISGRGNKTAFTFYVSNDLYLHRTKIEKAATLMQDERQTVLSPTISKSTQWVKRPITLNGKQDLAIHGIGWLTTNQPVELLLHLPVGVGYTVRSQLI